MAWTEDDLNKLEAAIAAGRGVRQMSFSDQTIVFHPVDEMLKLRAAMKHELYGATTSRNYRLASTSKGV